MIILMVGLVFVCRCFLLVIELLARTAVVVIGLLISRAPLDQYRKHPRGEL